MLGLGIGLSIAGVLFSLMAIMVVFMGNEGAAVPALLVPLLVGLPLTALLAVMTLRYWPGIGVKRALDACPGWVYVMLGVLASVLGIALLALFIAAHTLGESMPPRFHVPVATLAWYALSLGLFAGLVSLRSQLGADDAGGPPLAGG